MQKARDFPRGCVGHASHESDSLSIEGLRIQITKWFILLFLLIGPVCHAQSATVDWTNVHQVIDGLGASNADDGGTGVLLTPSQAAFFFGTGSGQIGLSILRVAVPNGATSGYAAGSCLTVSTSCVGITRQDITYATSYGVRIFGTPFSVPAAYSTNGSVNCSPGNGQLATAHYTDFATWLANWVKSMQTYQGVTPVTLAIANEPDFCATYPSTAYSATQIHDFITNNLGPTFASNSISTLILMPEVGKYGNLSLGFQCATDASCAAYMGGASFHDYDANVTLSSDTVNAATYPSGWAGDKRYWEDEVSCEAGGAGPNFCTASFDPSMTNALNWAAIIDHRFAVDNLNAWNYFWLIVAASSGNGEGLIQDTGAVAQRAYVMGQYAKFIRPGYFRIDATHAPQSGVSVSAYQNTTGNNLVIVATNYTGSPVTQTFNLVHAPTFSAVTPYITSATQNIQAQAAQSVSSNSFFYTLPADSVTTFVGTSSGSTGPVPPTKLQAVVN